MVYNAAHVFLTASYDPAENGQYQKVTKTVVGDENASSIVTTQYTDKTGNVVKAGKFLNGVEYFDTAAYDYVGNLITQLTAADAANGLEYTVPHFIYNFLNYSYNKYRWVESLFKCLGLTYTYPNGCIIIKTVYWVRL